MSTQKNEHNPDNLTPEQVGKGWRLLQYGEVIDPMDEMYITRFGKSNWEPTGQDAPGRIIEKVHYSHRRRITPTTDTTGSGREGVNYDGPAPETEAFMTLIDDSAVDLGQIQGKLAQFECERNAALAQVETLRRDKESAERRAAIWMSAVEGLPGGIDERFNEAAKRFDDRAAIDSAQRQEKP